MEPLKLAPTINTSRPDEVPQHDSILNSIEKRAKARIVEGYTLKVNYAGEHPYQFFSEINVDNNKLWSLVKSLVINLPEDVALIYNYKDSPTKYGRYSSKYSILNFLDRFYVEFTQDGFLEYGLIHSTPQLLEEVFVKHAKYVQYWGSDITWFENVMAEYDLMHIEDLQFIDEFPLTTTALRLYNPDVVETGELIKLFEEEYGNSQQD